ncbi:DUF2512 family protein [Brevibacillus sp. SYSU BS000544]|uniref:DUF2512 family protein n=1 Tax=Brevibacillus sp. SYSU BS000544 TaxID=3416443 RepID=UPI003CE4ABE3
MPILWKLLLTSAVVVPGLIWSNTSLLFAILSSIALSFLSFWLGDLMILPKTNNTFASTADFIMAFGFLWAAAVTFVQPYLLSGIFLTSFALSVVEYFFHDYLQRHGVHHSKHPG